MNPREKMSTDDKRRSETLGAEKGPFSPNPNSPSIPVRRRARAVT